MVKVIFMNGLHVCFHGQMYGHSIEHRAYCIPTPDNPKIMIPEQSVAFIGLWDEEKKEFKQ